MRSASVYKRTDGWYFHADSRSSGAWVATPPFFKLPLDATCGTLGKAIKTVINASLDDVPFPRDWGPVFQPALDLAGVKSWSAFARSATYVAVILKDPLLTVLPYKQDRGSFLPLEDRAFDLNIDANLEEIGEALQRGVALSK